MYNLLYRFLYYKKIPDSKNTITTLLAILGACLMGYERFHIEYIGFILMIFANFLTTLYTFSIEIFNKQKLITPFGIFLFLTPLEINLYYSFLGSVVYLVYSTYSNDLIDFFDLVSNIDESKRLLFAFCIFMQSILGMIIIMSVLLVCKILSNQALSVTCIIDLCDFE